MRPTSRELIEGVVAAIERDVAPGVSDRWAASALRSAVQLLNHLAVRVEKEAALLIEDNADARRVLSSISVQIGSSAAAAALRPLIEEALKTPEPPPYDPPRLDEANEALQGVIERVLRDEALAANAQTEAIRIELHRYLRRRLEREHLLYFPVFTGAPF